MFWFTRSTKKASRPQARIRQGEALESRSVFAADALPAYDIPAASSDAASEEVTLAPANGALAAGSPTIASSGYIRIKKLNSGG